MPSNSPADQSPNKAYPDRLPVWLVDALGGRTWICARDLGVAILQMRQWMAANGLGLGRYAALIPFPVHPNEPISIRVIRQSMPSDLGITRLPIGARGEYVVTCSALEWSLGRQGVFATTLQGPISLDGGTVMCALRAAHEPHRPQDGTGA